MIGGNFAGNGFLVGIAGIQVKVALEPLGLGHQRCVQDLFRHGGSMGFEMLPVDPVATTKSVHTLRSIKLPKLSLEDQAVKTLQHSSDKRAKTL
jgi:hypothetical protein